MPIGAILMEDLPYQGDLTVKHKQPEPWDAIFFVDDDHQFAIGEIIDARLTFIRVEGPEVQELADLLCRGEAGESRLNPMLRDRAYRINPEKLPPEVMGAILARHEEETRLDPKDPDLRKKWGGPFLIREEILKFAIEQKAPSKNVFDIGMDSEPVE